MNIELSLSTDVTELDTGRFIELPFTVPTDVSEIRVKITVTPNDNKPCIIDVGLCDPVQVRGWSGSTKYDLKVSMDDATPGYLQGEISPGQWAVLLGAYVVGKNGASVNVSITLIESQARWLQGDLHVHTVHSDGAYTLAELDAIARNLNLDFIALTDHNTVSQNFAFPRESPVTYIPAMELTTYHGHANLFGNPIPCDDFRVHSSSDVVKLFQKAKDMGAFVSINHPYDDAGPSCQWQWGYDVPFDWLEIWNGPWRPSNLQSLSLWQTMLTQGKRIIAVGGSDTHCEHPYVRHGYPTTYVYSPSPQVDAILTAIRAGHVSLSYRPGGPRIELHCGEAMMGDKIPTGDTIQIHIEGTEPQDVVVIIAETGELDRHEITESGTWEIEVNHAPKRFIRVELWRYFSEVDEMLLAAISNPIFFVEE